MSSSEIHLQAHFSSRAVQDDAARLGMWLFLATEILLFGGLFVAYAYYRFLFPVAFAHGSQELFVACGTTNTFVLVTSSFTVALALHHVRIGRNRSGFLLLATSVLLGLAFLGIKAWEYSQEIAQGHVPGTDLFVSLYYMTTGLHAFHVTAGISVLIWMAVKTARGEFSRDYHTPLELGALYWHLVDLIWLFLYPLLYLVGRSGS